MLRSLQCCGIRACVFGRSEATWRRGKLQIEAELQNIGLIGVLMCFDA